MKKPAIGKPRTAAAPLPSPETLAGLHPRLSTSPMAMAAPAPEPLPSPPIVSPTVATLDAETVAILAETYRTLLDVREQLGNPIQPAPLMPEMLQAIEDRAVERLAPLILNVMSHVMKASAAAEALPKQIEEAGAASVKQIDAIAETGRANMRVLTKETRDEVEALHKGARAEFRRSQSRVLAWIRRLSRFTHSQLSKAAQEAAGKVEATTAEPREAAREAAVELAAATAKAQEVADRILTTAASVEAAAEAIVDMAPTATQAVEIRGRAIARETGLTMLAGLALLIVASGGALWHLGVLR